MAHAASSTSLSHDTTSSRHGSQHDNEGSLSSSPIAIVPSRRVSAPLFDPHGLSASLHDGADTEGDMHLEREKGSAAKAEAREAQPEEAKAQKSNRRGRRRRSSEFVKALSDQSETGGQERTAHVKRSSVESTASRLWWQRVEEDEGSTNVPAQTATNAKSRPTVKTSSLEPNRRIRQVSEGTGTDETSRSPSIRSPAAAFLSSMNDMLASPPPISASQRGFSISPTRSDVSQSHRAAASDGFALQQSSRSGGGSSATGPLGLTGAAARLFEHASPSMQSVTSLTRSVRPDDEGARFGPNGRYMLGRTIGFGGFSTIREGWDLGEEAVEADQATSNDENKHKHRVAVKTVYSTEESKKEKEDEGDETDELDLWRSLPAHPHILPLLYHERIQLDDRVPSMANDAVKGGPTIDFLVMPFCSGNLLAFVRTGGAILDSERQTPSSSRSGSVSGAGLTRTASMRIDRTAIEKESVESSVGAQKQFNRTGSGFLPHARRSTSGADRLVSAPLSSLLGRSGSFAAPSTSVPGSMIRAGSIKGKVSQAQQSRGVDIRAAQAIMSQLTEALLCLHHKAAILHGDLKLENVLGQQWQTRQRSASQWQESVASGSSSEAPQTDPSEGDQRFDADDGDALTHDKSSTICWRVADFGLARRVPSKVEHDFHHHPKGHGFPPQTHPERFADLRGNESTSSSVRRNSSTANSRLHGGSLAYTAPEAFLVPEADEAGEASPYAPDMWALGCIMYALFAGKLPFMDSFEPRLQNKIAQGRWQMPDRLKRRRGGGNQTADGGATNMDRANSFGSYADPLPQSATQHTSPIPPLRSLPRAPDLSASMPSLPPRAGIARAISGLPFSDNANSIVFADDSTQGDTSALLGPELDEEDATSDAEDQGVDVEMDGTSKERCAVRKVLRGLLNTDAKKRWTIRQLAASEWIAGQVSAEEEVANISHRQDDEDLPTSLRAELEQESINRDSVAEFDDDGRGRARHREATGVAQIVEARKGSKPIDIDRSKSRSRSRVRDDSPMWGLDSPIAGGFNRRIKQGEEDARFRAHRQDELEDRPSDLQVRPATRPTSSTRSSSVDMYSRRGRSSGMSSSGSQTGRSGASRSTSRSRRADLDLIMPQLSLHRSIIDGQVGQNDGSGLSRAESREASPALPTADDHNVSRSSIWKSPFRARDRLANIVGGAAQERSGSQTPENNAATEDGGEERLWWQRGRALRKTDE